MSTEQYEQMYASGGDRMATWRAAGARIKAEHIERLATPVGRLLEIGVGDGALLAELDRRNLADELHGLEIAQSAVDLARERSYAHPVMIEHFDGMQISAADDSYDLAVLSHVLEHTSQPTLLLREAARVAP